jgi:hypothetical protein
MKVLIVSCHNIRDKFNQLKREVKEEFKQRFEIKDYLTKFSELKPFQIREILADQKLMRNFRKFTTHITYKARPRYSQYRGNHTLYKKAIERYEQRTSKIEKAEELREKYKLNTFSSIADHILKEDPSGQTKGCGCILCRYRNEIYKMQLKHRSLKVEISKYYNIMDDVNSAMITALEERGDNSLVDVVSLGSFSMGGVILRKKLIPIKKNSKETNKKTISPDSPAAIMDKARKLTRKWIREREELEAKIGKYTKALITLRTQMLFT